MIKTTSQPTPMTDGREAFRRSRQPHLLGANIDKEGGSQRDVSSRIAKVAQR